MADNVTVYHPDIPHTKETPVVVPRKKYDRLMYDKGWRIHPPKTDKKESK